MINFCFDNIVDKETCSIYPNLAESFPGKLEDIAGNFSTTYPYSDPPRLLNYLLDEDIPFEIHNSNNCPGDSFYFINVNFFDHSVNWFERMSPLTLKNVQNKKFKILFFYCEGDSPERIRNTLYKHAKLHSVDTQQIHFISHSTIAKHVDNFYYLNDDEILFKNAQNYSNSQSLWHNNPRKKKFTCLMRSHKNWRLVVGAYLYDLGLLSHSYSSYNKVDFSNGFDHTDDFFNAENNPLYNVLTHHQIADFKKIIPYSTDTLNDSQRNNYETFIDTYFSDAYWNIVVETHLNLDNTIGTFVTEKTWKPIRHNQPFIIIGTVGSLSHLRELGYRTFDGIIDESYDYIKDDNVRVNKIFDIIKELNKKTLAELNELNLQMKDIVQHNSELFNSSKSDRLLKLINQLLNNTE